MGCRSVVETEQGGEGRDRRQHHDGVDDELAHHEAGGGGRRREEQQADHEHAEQQETPADRAADRRRHLAIGVVGATLRGQAEAGDTPQATHERERRHDQGREGWRLHRQADVGHRFSCTVHVPEVARGETISYFIKIASLTSGHHSPPLRHAILGTL